MTGTLEKRFRFPAYLMIVKSYLRVRFLVYVTADCTARREITAGEAQAFIVRPDLWSAMYDGILCMNKPDNFYLVGDAGDIDTVSQRRSIVFFIFSDEEGHSCFIKANVKCGLTNC